jgi:murein DD-endopeptidase MepM/ murein hydrolase activator NlpD
MIREPMQIKTRRKILYARLLVYMVLAAAAVLATIRMIPVREKTKASRPLRVRLPLPAEPREEVLEGTVQRGESIAALLGDFLSPQEVHDLAGRCRKVFPLKKVRAGHSYRVLLLDGLLQGFEYEIDAAEQLVFRREPGGFAVLTEPIQYQTVVESVTGTIDSSLFQTVDTVGEKPELAMKIAEIFAWDVDFMLDIQPGDSFRAIVEKRYREGALFGYGRVLAAQFINEGKVKRGFLFEGASGRPEYYNAEGKNLRRAFLKTPLRFSRISSGFSGCRLHPITKVWRPHPGVDYAAPTGTPVKTVGDGTILTRAYDGASGNYVKIKHSGGYETAYLHLSRFAEGIQKGNRVKQGQVIGYVGSTGLATGPHLDFRVKKNGSYINPKDLKSTPGDPIPAGKKAEFLKAIEPLVVQLDGDRNVAWGREPFTDPWDPASLQDRMIR